MGGGGLVSGVGSVLKAFNPRIKVYGVSAINSKALATSMAVGRVVETKHLPTLAEAVSGGIDKDTITLPLAISAIDEVIECDEDEIVESLKMLAFDENMIVEGSAALALAGFNKIAQRLGGQTSVILLCGGNLDRDRIRETICGL